MRAIDYLKKHRGPLAPIEDVEKAAELHDSCGECFGAGGVYLYPEQPCPECGFTFADSFGLEKIPRKKK